MWSHWRVVQARCFSSARMGGKGKAGGRKGNAERRGGAAAGRGSRGAGSRRAQAGEGLSALRATNDMAEEVERNWDTVMYCSDKCRRGGEAAPSEFAGGKSGAVAGTGDAATTSGRTVGRMVHFTDRHTLWLLHCCCHGKNAWARHHGSAQLRATPSSPSSVRVLLYLPLAWLLQLIVSDMLHLFFHACTSLSTSARGWGWGVPGRVLAAIGHIHTVHHKHVDAFGKVDRQHKWASLLLDKLLKRSVIQYLSWKSWCGILRLDQLMEDFMRLPRSSAPRARCDGASDEVEVLRTAALVVQTVLHAESIPVLRATGRDAADASDVRSHD